ncbi:restriction endonuclease [Ruficoccus amylovorans]|uniref:Restriction endonuclease n=2 Tax=Ruficoccus amylovorans TaxID=1804625 RepID=A0A842HFW2_9BACT|nr:restriction endonuclease [Ruficoccus amylovorans]
MESGYVLDFSNQTFHELFSQEVGADIYSPSYEADGTSKAKRLRFFLRHAPPPQILKSLLALWQYRENMLSIDDKEDPFPKLRPQFAKLIERLGGRLPIGQDSQTTEEIQTIDNSVADKLITNLISLTSLEPRKRGYAFESFLRSMFDLNGLSARASFRLVGEQIDGSFTMDGETYLLEAKWENKPIGVADLHNFEGKIGEKAAWSRGLFVSNSGFSKDGLTAFGKGKRIVCMDGFDISEMLRLRLPFTQIMQRKVRYAAETGIYYAPVRDLF